MRKIIILFIFSFTPVFLSAQCSDAGVCSLGSHSVTKEQQRPNSLGINYSFAYSGKDEKIAYNTLQLSAKVVLTEKAYLAITFPFFRGISAEGVSNNGIGDVIASYNYKIHELSRWDIWMQLGGKFSTGDENGKKSAPMAFQTGLGTNDLLFGVLFAQKRWRVSAGYQLAQDKFNKNSLTPLKRGDDIYFKTSYNQKWVDAYFNFSVLLIKRLQKSIIKVNNVETEVSDSDPFQINLGVDAVYPLNKMFSLQGNMAMALIKRKNNVDGLTRALTAGAGLIYNF